MNLILRYLEGRKARTGSLSADPKLQQELNQTRTQLNSILNKWKFGDVPIRTSEEFLANFEPWINRQLEQQKDLKVFLAKKGVSSLTELASLPTEESEQLKFYRENIKIKEDIINEYKEAEQTWTNTEQDYLSRIEELKASRETSEEAETIKQELATAQQKHQQELAQQKQTFLNTEQDYLKRIADHEREIQAKVQEFQTSNGELLKQIQELKENRELPEDYEDLITERDEAIREKKTLEQSVLALNNRLNLKQQEVSNKDKALDKLKKEKSQLEVQQQKVLKEKNSLITTLNQELKQLEKESKKLTEKNQELDQQNVKLVQRLLELDPPKEVNL